VRANRVERRKDEKKSNKALGSALKNRDASTVTGLACAVISPLETFAPILGRVESQLKGPGKGKYKKEDSEKAQKMLSDLRYENTSFR
jgi:hypothetical protein